MNVRNLFGMNCINHLLDFSLNWSPGLTDLQPFDPSQSLVGVLLFRLDPFFLSVILRTLNTFMLRSANWNLMIPFIWVRSIYVGGSCSTWPSLHYKYLAPSPISDVNGVTKNSNSHISFTWLQHLFYVIVQTRVGGLPPISKQREEWKITRRSRVFLTNFEVFWNRRTSSLRVFERASQTNQYFARKSRRKLA